jgi:DNA polymerase III sliding clamp (beta) subunit (PCNA family)
MHIVLDTKTLAAAINSLSGIRSKHMAATIPVLGSVLLSHDGAGEVTLAVTDMALRGKATLANQQLHLESGKPDAIAIKIDVFAAQCKAASEATETITLKTTENFRLSLKAKRFSASMVGTDPQNYPRLDWALPEAELVIPAADLHKLLHSVSPTIDNNQFHDLHTLAGVHLSIGDMYVRSASADKVRMTACTVPIVDRRVSLVSMLIPKALVERSLPMLAALDDDELVSIGRSRVNRSIYIWHEDMILANTELAVSFPVSYLDKCLAMEFDSQRIVVSIPDLERVVNASLPFAMEERSETPKIHLHYANGTLRATCSNHTTGEFEAELDAQGEGISGAVDLDVNAAYLRSFVSSMKAMDDKMAIVPPVAGGIAIQFLPASDTEGRLRGWCARMI